MTFHTTRCAATALFHVALAKMQLCASFARIRDEFCNCARHFKILRRARLTSLAISLFESWTETGASRAGWRMTVGALRLEAEDRRLEVRRGDIEAPMTKSPKPHGEFWARHWSPLFH
jgi:hypothetical protein